MIRRQHRQTKTFSYYISVLIRCAFFIFLMVDTAFATQLHITSTGIITHQIGHIMFLFSMVVLIFTVRGKNLSGQKGWRMIQLSALFFILWNLDAIFAHFLDNQAMIVATKTLSFKSMMIETQNPFIALVYYVLKLDHLLCVPAMYFMYRGLSIMVKEQTAKKGDA